jgi:hypothetical protein
MSASGNIAGVCVFSTTAKTHVNPMSFNWGPALLARVTPLNRGGYMILDLGVPRLPVIVAVTVIAGATHSASNDPNRLVSSLLTSFNSPASLSIEFSRPIFLFLISLKLIRDILFMIIP